MSARMVELLDAAASELEEGRRPLCSDFLIRHDVTFDECVSLAELLATGARLVAFAMENPTVARGALEGAAFTSASETLRAALDKL